MNSRNHNLSLGEAAQHFLASLSPEEREAGQQEINRFVRWFGAECPLAGLTPPEIANFAQQVSATDSKAARKLDLVRVFLVYARDEGWVKNNLSIHLKLKKTKAKTIAALTKAPVETILTRQGYADLEAELAELKAKRAKSIEEIRLAAADKDFRENAPLAAAREHRGHLEGRIKEVEEILKNYKIAGERTEPVLKASIGDTVFLKDLSINEQMRYMLVSPTEVDPSQNRISSASPMGKALLGHRPGETIELTVPAGRLCYLIERVER